MALLTAAHVVREPLLRLADDAHRAWRKHRKRPANGVVRLGEELVGRLIDWRAGHRESSRGGDGEV